jgi:small subunit ribosomal protein S10
MAKNRIRIRLKAFDHRVLDDPCARSSMRPSAPARRHWPVPLPTRIEKFTVMRSPFIDKDSREQFEIRTHKRLIDVMDPGPRRSRI